MASTALLLSKLIFAIAGAAAAVRLAKQAREAGGRPLHAWASALIAIAGAGLLLFGAGPHVAPFSDSLAW